MIKDLLRLVFYKDKSMCATCIIIGLEKYLTSCHIMQLIDYFNAVLDYRRNEEKFTDLDSSCGE